MFMDSIINFLIVGEESNKHRINWFANPQRATGSGSGMFWFNSIIMQHFICVANGYFHECLLASQPIQRNIR